MDDNRINQLFDEVKKAIVFDHPKLDAKLEGDHVSVTGIYIVYPKADDNQEAGILAEYSIEVRIPSDFPLSNPEVIEAVGAFPKDLDHHCFSDGGCCLGFPLIEYGKNGSYDVKAFFDTTMHNYFFGQWCLSKGESWPFGEYTHGKDGVREAYSELFECLPTDQAICAWLKLLLRPKFKDYYSCPCRSGKIIRNCCLSPTKKFFSSPYTQKFRESLVSYYVSNVLRD